MTEEKYSEWQERYDQELNDYQRKSLRRLWPDLREFLETSDRSWVKKKNMRDSLNNPKKEHSTAFDAFTEVYQPPESAPAIALYQIRENDDLDDFESAIDSLESDYGKDDGNSDEWKRAFDELGIDPEI